jgi:hypothetical protein
MRTKEKNSVLGSVGINEGYLRNPIRRIKSKPGSTVMKNEPSFRSSLTKPFPWGYFSKTKDAKGLIERGDHPRNRKGHVYTLTKEAVWI